MMWMFCKEDRCRGIVDSKPPVETGGYKACPDFSGMIDVIRSLSTCYSVGNGKTSKV
jgi:hypothetical protein